jgi:hypothetical protein
MTIFFCVLPGSLFLFKNKEYKNKNLFESFLFMLPVVVVLETFAHSSKAWYESTLFSFRIFNLFPLESFLWGISYYILLIATYEYFFDKKNKPKFNKRFKIALAFVYFALIITLICLFFFPTLLTIPYFYTVFLTTILILTAIAAIKSPVIFKRGSLLSLFFLIPGILHEYISLKLGHWLFTEGFHIGYLTISNHIIPIEEIFWIPLFPIWIALFYEFFQDDFK